MLQMAVGCLASLLTIFGNVALASQQAPVDVQRIGPQVGAAAPEFSGVDQFGRTHTLSSVMGSAGVMLVFFRSADW